MSPFSHFFFFLFSPSCEFSSWWRHLQPDLFSLAGTLCQIATLGSYVIPWNTLHDGWLFNTACWWNIKCSKKDESHQDQFVIRRRERQGKQGRMEGSILAAGGRLPVWHQHSVTSWPACSRSSGAFVLSILALEHLTCSETNWSCVRSHIGSHAARIKQLSHGWHQVTGVADDDEDDEVLLGVFQCGAAGD